MERDAGVGGQRRDRRASVSADSSGRTGERVPDGGQNPVDKNMKYFFDFYVVVT